MQILIVTTRATKLSAFFDALEHGIQGVELLIADSWANALAAAKVMAPTFVIFDEGLPEGTALELVRKLLSVNPAIDAVVVTPLDNVAFHDASEGLGVLATVPEHPTGKDGRTLAELLQRVKARRDLTLV